MGKKIISGIIVILSLGALVFIVTTRNSKPAEEARLHKINVVTTLFPLYDFAKNIGRTKVEVSLLLPPGIEALNPSRATLSRLTKRMFSYTQGNLWSLGLRILLRASPIKISL
jgi:zinc transport system substrate-binding protein